MTLASSRFSIEDVFDIVLPPYLCSNGYLVMLYVAYIDDSKDARQENTIVAAALFARKRTWKCFSLRWKKELRKHGIKYFKSSEFRGLRDEFRVFRKYPIPEGKQKAERLACKLDGIIRKYRIYGVPIVVPVKVFKKVAGMPESHGYFNCDPYQRCLESIFLHVIRATDLLPGKDNVLAFVHDDDSQFPQFRKYYRAFKKLNPEIAKRMMGFIPLDDKLLPPLQAADRLANYTKNIAQTWTGETLATPARLPVRIIRTGVWTEDYMLRVAHQNEADKSKRKKDEREKRRIRKIHKANGAPSERPT